MEESVYEIVFPKTITSPNFFDFIVPQLNDYQIYGMRKRVRFVFSGVTAINAYGLAYTLCAAEGIKNICGEKVIFSLPPFSDKETQRFLRFLINTHVFDIANKMALFTYEHAIGSSYKKDEIYKGIDEQYFAFLENYSSMSEYSRQGKMWDTFFHEKVVSENIDDEFRDVFGNLLKSGLHTTLSAFINETASNSRDRAAANMYCFGCYQRKWRKIRFCFADIGKGFNFEIMQDRLRFNNNKKELIFKNCKKVFYSGNSEIDINCKKVLEALFLRRGDAQYNGLYGLLELLSDYKEKNKDKNVSIKIHSNKCFVKLANSDLLELANDDSKRLDNNAFAEKTYKLLTNDIYKNKISETKRFSGVHIELELEY